MILGIGRTLAAHEPGRRKQGPEYLSTHPNPETRITQLQGWMPQALQYYQNPNLALPNKR